MLLEEYLLIMNKHSVEVSHVGVEHASSPWVKRVCAQFIRVSYVDSSRSP